MTTTAAADTTTRAPWSTKNKVGLGLALAYALVNLPSAFTPVPEGDAGPPMAILVVCTVLAAVALVTVALNLPWSAGLVAPLTSLVVLATWLAWLLGTQA